MKLPTMGRIVHLHRFGAPPAAALITGIVDAEHVNVVAFEIMGLTFELHVPFWHDDGDGNPPVDAEHRCYWIWPPVMQ